MEWWTSVSNVEPHRAVWNKKMSSPFGSPITSANRWNVLRGTTIRCLQNFICAWRANELYSLRHRCIPVNHDSVLMMYHPQLQTVAEVAISATTASCAVAALSGVQFCIMSCSRTMNSTIGIEKWKTQTSKIFAT